MQDWLIHFWNHLHTAAGLLETIQTGGLILLFIIIFSETGLLVGFFLPGDSLLVTAGVLTIQNGDRPALFDPWLLTALLIIAAILGNQLGWWLGNKYGHRVADRPDTWLIKKKHLNAARVYFSENGASSLLLARFIPILRTFVPFAAGMGEMEFRHFLKYNIIGACLWIGSLIWIGHFIGGTALADELHKVILIVVFVSFLPLLWKIAKTFLANFNRNP